jgi:hypothetical protein
VSAASQVYYANFDAVFLKLPPALRGRIEQKIDEIGLRLPAYPQQQVWCATGEPLPVAVERRMTKNEGRIVLNLKAS